MPTIANYTTITHAAPAFSGASPNAWTSIDAGPAGGDFFADFGNPMSNINRTDEPAGYFSLNFSIIL